MANAKQEFLLVTVNHRVKCAFVTLGDDWRNEEQKKLILKLNYSAEEYESFLKGLDFEYDDGYGGQELFGNIWAEDGTWFSRGEYDGSEWWQHNILPEIPNECL